MNDWIMPLVFGAAFYVLGTLRSRAISRGRPLTKLSRALRSYGTIWAVGEGYLMIGIRSLLEGTTLYKKAGVIVTATSLVWMAIVTVIALMLNRSRRAGGPKDKPDQSRLV